MLGRRMAEYIYSSTHSLLTLTLDGSDQQHAAAVLRPGEI